MSFSNTCLCTAWCQTNSNTEWIGANQQKWGLWSLYIN